ncbi:MAG: HEAT repeat domain-containing protein [Planctomycetota bacterium]
MQAIIPMLLMALGQAAPPASEWPSDPARLREMLRDKAQPRLQAQAALALLQLPSAEADAVIRQGLEQSEDPEMFLALVSAIRLTRDARYGEELTRALSRARGAERSGAAEALSALLDARLAARLKLVIDDPRADIRARLSAIGALGRSGRRVAAEPLLAALESGDEALRLAAADALADLSGWRYGPDIAKWRAWWERHREMPPERWLEIRLAFQNSRVARLESELESARGQTVRLHQQLYARLGGAERLVYIPSLMEQEDHAVRLLAVGWAQEMLASTDPAVQKSMGPLLVRLTADPSAEVQRAAVLALGRVQETTAFDRLLAMAASPSPAIRAVAARALALQARQPSPEAARRAALVLAALGKLLEDPVIDVVVEAAEDLGNLGVPEAGPVLTGLLGHPGESVRKAAAQALERVAQPPALDKILRGLDDPSGAVRFSLVGAIGNMAASGSAPLGAVDQTRVLARLEVTLLKDPDPTVRARAASALGECGQAALLPVMWRACQAVEDVRVQEKAWLGMIDIIARMRQLPVLVEWNKTLGENRQGARQLQMLSEVMARWQRVPEARADMVPLQDMLVPAALEQGKWTVALPVLRDALARQATPTEQQARLRWLLQAAEHALAEGNKGEALRAGQDGLTFAPKGSPLIAPFGEVVRRAGN